MFVHQVDVVPVTTAVGTVLTIRETNTGTRLFQFKNLASSTLSILLEYSADGGSTWSTDVSSFDLPAGDVISKVSTRTEVLRVRVSGATDPQGLMIGYSRTYDDSSYIWSKPTA